MCSLGTICQWPLEWRVWLRNHTWWVCIGYWATCASRQRLICFCSCIYGYQGSQPGDYIPGRFSSPCILYWNFTLLQILCPSTREESTADYYWFRLGSLRNWFSWMAASKADMNCCSTEAFWHFKHRILYAECLFSCPCKIELIYYSCRSCLESQYGNWLFLNTYFASVFQVGSAQIHHQHWAFLHFVCILQVVVVEYSCQFAISRIEFTPLRTHFVGILGYSR